jgi:hypothetical protein
VPETIQEQFIVNHVEANPKFKPSAHAGGPDPNITFTRVTVTAEPAHITAGGDSGNGRITVAGKDDQPMAEMIAGDKEAVIAAGQKGGRPGRLTLYDGTGSPTMNLTATDQHVSVCDDAGKEMFSFNPGAVKGTAGLMIGIYQPTGGRPGWIAIRDQKGKDAIYLDGKTGVIAVRDDAGNDAIQIDGRKGDIVLLGADCAEEFELGTNKTAEPGSVVIIHGDGRIGESHQPYDRAVAGVVSGAGNCRPGVVLGKQRDHRRWLPVALLGKVYCKVDARPAAIEIGDLLTTSATVGHAMKATDTSKAFGAVLGKALQPLERRTGLIPILVALQ